MTLECGSPAESKNCEILLLPTADRRFDTKVKCPTGQASFWVKFPHRTELYASHMPGDCPGGGAMGGFGIDWYISVTLNLPISAAYFKHHNSTVNAFLVVQTLKRVIHKLALSASDQRMHLTPE